MNPLSEMKDRLQAIDDELWSFHPAGRQGGRLRAKVILNLKDPPEVWNRKADLVNESNRLDREYKQLKRKAGLRHRTSIHSHRV